MKPQKVVAEQGTCLTLLPNKEAMLSGILKSDKAIRMNISIMRAFVEVTKIIYLKNDLKEQIEQIKKHLGNHDAQLNQCNRY